MNRLYITLLISLWMSFLIVSCTNDVGQDDLEDSPFDEMVIDNPQVEMNPSGITPLSARISLNTKVKSKVKVEIVGSPSISYTFNTLTDHHEIPIVGLFANSLNQVIVTLTDTKDRTGSKTFEIQTPAIPDYFPDITIDKSPSGPDTHFMTMVGMAIGNAGTWEVYPIAFDTEGNMRWYMDLSSYSEGNYDGRVSPIRILKNGNLCFGGRKSSLIEMDLLGFERNKWTFDGYDQHHEILELENGNFILAVDKDGIGTVEDHIIEIDRNSGDILRKWDMRQYLDVTRYDLIENEPLVEKEKDWFHMNGLAYNEEDKSLIISGRHQGLVKVSQNDELQWILAPHQGWGAAGIDGEGPETSQFLLTAVDKSGDPYSQIVQNGGENTANFSWVWGQHAPMLLPNGNIFVFDNGYRRNFDTEASFSRGVEYSVNSSNKTVTQEWQYGAERGENLHSEILSDVDVTEDGTRILTSGIININNTDFYSRIVEVSYPGKEVLFEATLSFKNELSKGFEFFGNIDIVYRSERFHFYE
jgi:arylsulfate sulfotransferase